MEIRGFPRQDLLEFTRELRRADPELAERSSEDEALFASTPGETLGAMQDNAGLRAVAQQKLARKLAWASAGLLLGAGVTFFGSVGAHPVTAVGAALGLGAASALSYYGRVRAEKEAHSMVLSRARLGTYGSVLARLSEAETEVKNLARGLTPEQSLSLRQDENALIVGGVRVKRHSGKNDSCSR